MLDGYPEVVTVAMTRVFSQARLFSGWKVYLPPMNSLPPRDYD